MARKTIVQLFDDLDGSAGEDISTVSFALDGISYDIDLSTSNATRLRTELGEFISAARRTGGRVKRGGGTQTTSGGSGESRSKEETKAIREWARQNGHDISERGRIPGSVIEAYESAQAAPAGGGKPKGGKPKLAAFSG
ncbi:Lsr2 family protein [Actinokineospora sp. UTMC 2448]|uniref:histone-like nucleoid-structuring protein Lsr2 n=1 Tax=Actinokineospora sp. UTMC 2448 TaxID=2268449 RepID=UPI0021648974|nr:Lsr2 family protein [Actinokineospora sp. UTMC 2448]UVS78423.1 Nucleoid-associated protein Lsr2 [Actinokineospora sp. UTMC 2448]